MGHAALCFFAPHAHFTSRKIYLSDKLLESANYYEKLPPSAGVFTVTYWLTQVILISLKKINWLNDVWWFESISFTML